MTVSKRQNANARALDSRKEIRGVWADLVEEGETLLSDYPAVRQADIAERMGLVTVKERLRRDSTFSKVDAYDPESRAASKGWVLRLPGDDPEEGGR